MNLPYNHQFHGLSGSGAYTKLAKIENRRFEYFHNLAIGVKTGASKELQLEVVRLHKCCFNYIDDPYPEVIELNRFLWEL